jgi:hypothetical protein
MQFFSLAMLRVKRWGSGADINGVSGIIRGEAPNCEVATAMAFSSCSTRPSRCMSENARREVGTEPLP